MSKKFKKDQAEDKDYEDRKIWERYTIKGLLYQDIIQGILRSEADSNKQKFSIEELPEVERYYQNVANYLLEHGTYEGFNPEDYCIGDKMRDKNWLSLIKRCNSSIFQASASQAQGNFMHRSFAEYYVAKTMKMHWERIVEIEDDEEKMQNILHAIQVECSREEAYTIFDDYVNKKISIKGELEFSKLKEIISISDERKADIYEYLMAHVSPEVHHSHRDNALSLLCYVGGGYNEKIVETMAFVENLKHHFADFNLAKIMNFRRTSPALI